MKHLRKILTLSVTMLSLLFARPIATQAQTQMGNVKHVFIILMENHNWTGDNSGASFGAPDIKASPLAPYINSLIPLRAHAEQYFNPPGTILVCLITCGSKQGQISVSLMTTFPHGKMGILSTVKPQPRIW